MVAAKSLVELLSTDKFSRIFTLWSCKLNALFFIVFSSFGVNRTVTDDTSKHYFNQSEATIITGNIQPTSMKTKKMIHLEMRFV